MKLLWIFIAVDQTLQEEHLTLDLVHVGEDVNMLIDCFETAGQVGVVSRLLRDGIINPVSGTG